MICSHYSIFGLAELLLSLLALNINYSLLLNMILNSSSMLGRGRFYVLWFIVLLDDIEPL